MSKKENLKELEIESGKIRSKKYKIKPKDLKKKVILKVKATCNNCKEVHDLDELIDTLENQGGSIPFSAKSSSSRIYCTNCSSFNFHLNYEYVRKSR